MLLIDFFSFIFSTEKDRFDRVFGGHGLNSCYHTYHPAYLEVYTKLRWTTALLLILHSFSFVYFLIFICMKYRFIVAHYFTFLHVNFVRSYRVVGL